MTQLAACNKCNTEPELVDGRTQWFVRCGCPPGDNVVYGQSVAFLDHISVHDDDELTDYVSDVVFGLVPWDQLKQSAVDAWNSDRHAAKLKEDNARLRGALLFCVPHAEFALQGQMFSEGMASARATLRETESST
jgi:ssDNA-binding Zn-finger/Zn-ribbon topoisomerase 1